MKANYTIALFAAAVLFPAVNALAINLSFDGTTKGGWALLAADGSPANQLYAVADFSASGLNGLTFDDVTGGVMYYSAPASLLAANFTGSTLDFSYQLNSAHSGIAFTFPLSGFSELYVNGTAIPDLDIIDETMMDAIQTVSIDFSNPALSSIDAANITSLWIKAEWWGDDVKPSVESHILGTPVPEPSTSLLLLVSALGVVGYAVRRRS